MDDSELLSHLRAAVIVVEPDGTISRAAGGADGVLGYAMDELVGRNAMEFVAPSDLEDVAFVFTGDGNHIKRPTQPPFSLRLVNRAGEVETVACLARGLACEGGFRWVLTLTPRDLQPVPYRALDSFLDGADATGVAARVVAELRAATFEGVAIDGFVLHRPVEGALTAVADEADPSPLRAALVACLSEPDLPWNRVGGTHTAALGTDALPPSLAAATEEAGFRSLRVVSVSVDDAPGVAVVLFGNHPTSFSGNISLILDDAAEVMTMALTRSRADEVLRRAAEHDPLTGLANRARFARGVEDITDPDVAVLYADLDGFKAINDGYGHIVGDNVLVEVAARIRSACRPGDEVARVGGDEFAVLLRGVDEAEATAVARRILERVAAPLPAELGPRGVTATVGMATPADASEHMIASADAALLAGKRTGRGCLAAVPAGDEVPA